MHTAQHVESTTAQTVVRTFGPGRSVSGLEFERYFTDGVDPFDEIEWELRSALIANEKGELVFEQRDVEFPKLLVAAGDQHRRLQIFSRAGRHAGA